MIKFKEEFNKGDYYKLARDTRTPIQLLKRIQFIAINKKCLYNRVTKTIKIKEKYKQERKYLKSLINHIKTLQNNPEINTLEIEYLIEEMWNLTIVRTAFKYKVIIPKFGNEQNFNDYSYSYYYEQQFIDDIIDGKIKI